MDFQTPITHKSEAVKVLQKKIDTHKNILESPYKLLSHACVMFDTPPNKLTMSSFYQYKEKLTIELNDFEKAIDLITKETYD